MAEITINNESLRQTFHYVATIENALNKEFKRVENEKSYLDKLVPEFLIEKYSQKLRDALGFKDNISKTAYNSGLVLLIGTFERIMLAKCQTSIGSIKSILRDHKTSKFDYYASRERFVHSYDKLSDIINLIEGHVNAALMIKLGEIKEKRNIIAHGSLDALVSPIDYSLAEIAKILDDIILEIEVKHE